MMPVLNCNVTNLVSTTEKKTDNSHFFSSQMSQKVRIVGNKLVIVFFFLQKWTLCLRQKPCG